MYMFTQCSRQLGSFPPTLMFQAQIKGKCSPVPYRAQIPFTQSCSCRRRGFVPPLHLGVEGTLHKLDQSHFHNARLVSSKSPLAWVTAWQMPGIRFISFNRCSWETRSVGWAGPAFTPCPGDQTVRSASTKEGPEGSQCAHWMAQRLCQERPGCWAEAWHKHRMNACWGRGVGAGGMDSRSWWLGHMAPKPGQWCSVADWGHGRIAGSKLRGKVQRTAPKIWSNVK